MAQHIPSKPSSGTKVESFWYKAWFQSLWSYFNRETDVAASSTASKTLGAEFYWPVDATSGAVTITLPPANTWLGKKYLIKKTDASANAVTINRSGSDTVDGATSVSLTTRYDSILLVSNGVSAWAKVSTMGTVGGYLLAANNLSDVATRQTALDNLTAVSGATNEYVLTKDTATGNAIWKASAGGGGSTFSYGKLVMATRYVGSWL